ncbi:Uu.00g013270.m01.CDS01 [Anthostomella pinea]|uniref:Uu.00g013270.m01.CDS01 n=1 Tax=Anthostomella pinea TaxID=933095 RepID=A0AAI8VY37_9PEZI|nr:Uu.00g013270.m01.CDS01 [Anthostomella pinea]
MSWEKVSESGVRWERPMDGIEGYFTFMASLTAGLCEGREHYTLCSVLKLETGPGDITPALKQAWKQVRYEQPQIATTVDGMKKVYEVPDERALEEWLSSTFIVSSASSFDELYPSVKPIKQATLYYLPKSSEIALRAHHHVIDGIGMLLFWHTYLEALKSPAKEIKFGDETARLAPVMEEVLPKDEHPSEELDKARAKEAYERFMGWAGSIPGIGPVSQVGAVPSGACQNTELVFAADTTSSLIAACKAKGFTVGAAVHAAYIKAIEKHADPNSKLAEYVTATQFNLRPYLKEPFSSSKYAASVYYTPLPYKHALPASYSDLANSLTEYYKTSFKGKPEMLKIKGHFTQVLCGAVQTDEFKAGPVPKDALVSSLGLVEQYVGREYGSEIKVKDLKVGVDVVAGMSFLFFYTFQDKLRLVYGFNDGFEKPEDIQTYLNETKTILEKELLGQETG